MASYLDFFTQWLEPNVSVNPKLRLNQGKSIRVVGPDVHFGSEGKDFDGRFAHEWVRIF